MYTRPIKATHSKGIILFHIIDARDTCNQQHRCYNTLARYGVLKLTSPVTTATGYAVEVTSIRCGFEVFSVVVVTIKPVVE